MGDPFPQFLPRLQECYERHRDPARAATMSAYMRGQFPFLGIPSPQQKALLRDVLTGIGKPGQHDLREAAMGLWRLPEREYQYAAAALLRRFVQVCDEACLSTIHHLIITKSWWDTVDALAVHVVGPLAARFPALNAVMDGWASSANIWLARTAILHQIAYKDRTDSSRLFRYCLERSGDTEFFIRKAIGWALREYSKTDGDAVRTFVSQHEAELSGLSKREAMLRLNGGRRKPAVS